MNFVRGIEPLRAMKIGIVTWNNLNSGCELKSRRTVPLTTLTGVYRFVSDGAKQVARIDSQKTFVIRSLERKKRGIIKIRYAESYGEFIIEGSIERFRKYFDIIQQR